MKDAVQGLREWGWSLVVGLLLGVGFAVGCTGPRVGGDAEDTAPEPGTRVYDVQIHMAEQKDQAAQVLGRAVQWWESQPSSERSPLVQDAPSSDKAVTIEWKAPLYRVRLGPFATRQQAERVLRNARSTFPEAFVAPDRIEAP